jgi:DnaJ homolog subfamily A member 5
MRRFAALQQAHEVRVLAYADSVLSYSHHPCHHQGHAWYDSHRSGLAPEPDTATVVNDIKKGIAPSCARDRGLTVRHIWAFQDPSIWSGFEDEVHEENVWLWDALR